MTDKQSQKGGNDSTNIQAGTMVVNFGIDEKRAREIYQEMSLQLRDEYSQEALKIAKNRVEQFENSLMPKMEKVDGALEAFADPGFQLLLVEAQKTAASTERPVDYDLLSELLIHRFEKGGDRVMRAGISRAVEIVDEISDEGLLGLTVAHAASVFFPVTGDVIQGLNVLNDLFGKIIYGQLPVGQTWIDHLDILDAVRFSSFGSMKKIEQYYPENMTGYVDVGIEKNSEDHRKALKLLQENGVPKDILVSHVFNEGYLRINVRRKEDIDSITLRQTFVHNGNAVTNVSHLSNSQINAVKSIYDIYSADSNLKNKNIEAFINELDKMPNLKTLREWWDSIPGMFQITSVGKVLAHSNAKRCDKSIPSFT